MAVALVLLIDATFFGRFAPWEWMRAGMREDQFMELGVATDHINLASGAQVEHASDLVAILGSSRAARGLLVTSLARGPLASTEFMRICHAGLGPFELRAMADDVARTHPDVVVILASEFDTHRPPRLQTNLGAGSVGAVSDLARLAGSAFVFEHRDSFLGLGLSALLDAYRYRNMWAAAGLARWRNFLPDKEVQKRALIEAPFVFEGEAPLPVNLPKMLAALELALPKASSHLIRAGVVQLRSVARGPHAALQMSLLERTVDILLDGGARVLIVEGPVHPVSKRLVRPEPADEFRAFARQLETRDGVEVLWLSESGPFSAAAFGDLTHLDDLGAERLCAAVRARLVSMLPDAR